MSGRFGAEESCQNLRLCKTLDGGVRAGEGVAEGMLAREGGDGAGNREDRSGATVVPAAPLDLIAHTHLLLSFAFVVHTMDAMSGAMQFSRG